MWHASPVLIEYTIEVECEPKRRLGVDGLFDRLRCLAGTMATDTPAPEETMAARRAEFQLRPLAFHCTRCPANHQGRAFGCFGMIQCPVSEEAEEWLIELLPETLKPGKEAPQVEYLQELIHRLRSFEITGKAVDDHHRTGSLIEARRGFGKRYGSILRPQVLTSSQLFQLLFLQERVEPADAELVCRALGVWEDGGIGDDGLPEVIFTQPADEDDDPSIGDLKHFLMALMVACSMEVGMRTRLHEASGAESTLGSSLRPTERAGEPR